MFVREELDPRARGAKARRRQVLARFAPVWAVLGLGASACTSPPSYTLSWSLIANDGDLGQAPSLDSVRQCSEVGIAQIRVTAISAGVSISVDEYPCFPGSTIEGPTLEPGDYTLEIEGLRRTGGTWNFDPDETSEDQRIAYAEAEVSVTEGGLPNIDFVLRAPPECDDGIDNDNDGRVDARDPACIIDATNLELADSGISLVQSSVSFLYAANPVVRPTNLGIRSLRLEIEDLVVATIQDFELDYSRAPFRLPLVAETLPAGSYAVTLTALDAGGQALTEPLASSVPLGVPEAQTGFLLEDFVFSADTFLEPLLLPFIFSQQLRLSPIGSEPIKTSLCELGGFAKVDDTFVPIRLDELQIRVTRVDTSDPSVVEETLDAASLGLTFINNTPVETTDAGDWVSFACPSAAIRSEALDWGRHQIELRGLIGGEPCFSSSDVTDLAPQSGTNAQPFTLERVFEGDSVPVACYECSEDADDCDDGKVCDLDQHICVDQEPSGG